MIKDAIANFARDRNFENFSSRNRLQNVGNLASAALMSRVGTQGDPLKNRAWDC
jgi:hypothetical protein